MEIRLLGTAAAEGWPAVFCRCANCQRARAAGGKDLRARASACVDGIFQFDFGPDTFHQVLQGHVLAEVRHLICTHSHEDHLAASEFRWRVEPFAHGQEAALPVYGNARVLERIAAALDPARVGLELHELRPFEPVAIADAQLLPLLADHDPKETCLLHLFGRGGRWLLYGHDTGYFPAATWDHLRQWAQAGNRLDVALLDCTSGPRPGRRGHMGIPAATEVRQELLAAGIARPETRMVLTHFSHNGGLLQAELEAQAAPLGFEIAYDGMVITV